MKLLLALCFLFALTQQNVLDVKSLKMNNLVKDLLVCDETVRLIQPKFGGVKDYIFTASKVTIEEELLSCFDNLSELSKRNNLNYYKEQAQEIVTDILKAEAEKTITEDQPSLYFLFGRLCNEFHKDTTQHYILSTETFDLEVFSNEDITLDEAVEIYDRDLKSCFVANPALLNSEFRDAMLNKYFKEPNVHY